MGQRRTRASPQTTHTPNPPHSQGWAPSLRTQEGVQLLSGKGQAFSEKDYTQKQHPVCGDLPSQACPHSYPCRSSRASAQTLRRGPVVRPACDATRVHHMHLQGWSPLGPPSWALSPHAGAAKGALGPLLTRAHIGPTLSARCRT